MSNATVLKALDEAVQLAEIASDWHLEEVEIDGEMVGIYDLQDRFKAALAAQPTEPMRVRLDGEALREGLAEYAHEAWSGWMKYLFDKCTRIVDGNGNEVGLIIPLFEMERWQRQANTAYADLPAEEKESDRLEADRMIEVMDRTPLEQP